MLDSWPRRWTIFPNGVGTRGERLLKQNERKMCARREAVGENEWGCDRKDWRAPKKAGGWQGPTRHCEPAYLNGKKTARTWGREITLLMWTCGRHL